MTRRNNDSAQRHVLMLHGAGGGGWEWNVWQRVFAAHAWEVITLDFAPSASGLATTTLDDYAAQAVSSAAHDSVLIGASLGGLVALVTASQIRPHAIVLINPLPPAQIGESVIENNGRTRDYTDVVPWASGRSLASTLRAMPDADDAARLFAYRHWRDESGLVLRAAQNATSVEKPTCPMLVLASEHDEDVRPTASLALAQACDAEFRLLRGASHVGPLLGRDAARHAQAAINWLVNL